MTAITKGKGNWLRNLKDSINRIFFPKPKQYINILSPPQYKMLTSLKEYL